jgi:hypothetical protein
MPYPNPTPATLAHGAIVDQLDAEGIQPGDQLHQGVNIAADEAVAGFHPLNGRHRKARTLRQLALVNADQGTCSAELGSSYHVLSISYPLLTIVSFA